MGIPLAPTFLNIVLVLTWLIYLLLLLGVALAVIILTNAGGMRDTIVAVDRVRLAKDPVGAHNRVKRIVYREFLPIFAGAAVLNRVAQIWLPRMQPSISRVVLGTVVALVLGLLLFSLKIFSPLIYGSLEGIFAIASCGFSLSTMGEKLTTAAVIGLMTSIYLMIRAFDNIKKGLDPRKEKRKAARAAAKAKAEAELDAESSSENPELLNIPTSLP